MMLKNTVTPADPTYGLPAPKRMKTYTSGIVPDWIWAKGGVPTPHGVLHADYRMVGDW